MTRADGSQAARAPWPGGAAWIGGEYRPVEEAKISVLDRGVTRSDATYDVVHVTVMKNARDNARRADRREQASRSGSG
jgi:hypothetical protein